MASSQEAGQPQLTWANLVATIGVLILMVGGFWALVQSEFSAIRSQMQDKVSALEKRNDVQDRELRDIHNELLQRRNEFVQQFEFRQFENSANDRGAHRPRSTGRRSTRIFHQSMGSVAPGAG